MSPDNRRYPTAAETDRLIEMLEHPMTVGRIAKAAHIRPDRARFALSNLCARGLVMSRRTRDGRRLWMRRRCA